MSNHNTIALDGFIQAGDRVVIDSIPEYSSHPDLPVGTVLICRGHTQYHTEVDFGWIRKHRPRGRYLKFGVALYEVANSEKDFPQYHRRYITYFAHNLVFEDQTLDPQKTRRDTFEWSMYNDGVRVSDLPETAFVYGDRVRFVDDQTRFECENFSHGVVQPVTYGLHENPNVLYDIHCYFNNEDGGISSGYTHSYIDGSLLVLEERGNYYHYLHDPSKIAFTDLNERAMFYTDLGERKVVRNPRNELYMWTLDEALLHIREGKGAALHVSSGLFGAPTHLLVYSFPGMPELEAELREATMKGFAERYAELDAGAEVELSPTYAEWEADLKLKHEERMAAVNARANSD